MTLKISTKRPSPSLSVRNLLAQTTLKLKKKSLITNPEAEAREIICFVLRVTSAWIIAHGDEIVDNARVKKIDNIIARRIGGEPLAYIVGTTQFCGIDLIVSDQVLIPRFETEMLVNEAIAKLSLRGTPRQSDTLVSSRPTWRDPFLNKTDKGSSRRPSGAPQDDDYIRAPRPFGTRDDKHENRFNILDVGTGSGAIAVALGNNIRQKKLDAKIIATDISATALKIARRNIIAHNLSTIIRTQKSNLLSAVKRPGDLIIANLPYVPTKQCRNLKDPLLALDGGPDGIALIVKLLDQIHGRALINRGGAIILEIGHNQGKKLESIAISLWPKAKITTEKDLTGFDRMLTIDPRT